MGAARDRLSARRKSATTSDDAEPDRDTSAVTVSATEAQNEFGHVMDQAAGDRIVVITRRNVPRVVMMSFERYRAMAAAEATILNTLADEFDALFARMQTPEVRAGMDRVFRMSPEDMGRAAQAAALRDGEPTRER